MPNEFGDHGASKYKIEKSYNISNFYFGFEKQGNVSAEAPLNANIVEGVQPAEGQNAVIANFRPRSTPKIHLQRLLHPHRVSTAG